MEDTLYSHIVSTPKSKPSKLTEPPITMIADNLEPTLLLQVLLLLLEQHILPWFDHLYIIQIFIKQKKV